VRTWHKEQEVRVIWVTCPPPLMSPGGVLTLLSCRVQSSRSALEQYMGRWPMVMIHGRATRFALAFWRERSE
jgi:hypothetical protein